MKKSRHGRLGVDAMLSDQTKKTKFIRSHMFLKVLSSLRMLLSQGVPIRGHDDIEGSLMQLLLLRSEDDPQLKKWITSNNYLSPNIMNECITIMSST